MQPSPAPFVAPASWRTVDFVSDLHLHADDEATYLTFARYLRDTPADAVFLLGDIFEVWVGDDAALPSSFEAACGELLRQASATRALFFQHGNRDFLVGPAFLDSVGVRLLDDPFSLDLHGRRWLLSHGDALCLDDHDYQRFRAEVRSPTWQSAFLARPLEERRAIARQLREASEAQKRSGADYADVGSNAATDWLRRAGAAALIHGHTHRPAEHALPGGLRRIVLSDWDMRATTPRAEALRIGPDGEPVRIALT